MATLRPIDSGHNGREIWGCFVEMQGPSSPGLARRRRAAEAEVKRPAPRGTTGTSELKSSDDLTRTCGPICEYSALINAAEARESERRLQSRIWASALRAVRIVVLSG